MIGEAVEKKGQEDGKNAGNGEEWDGGENEETGKV